MKRNKKLISLVCAIAMIFSMLSGLAITANAAGEGFTLSVGDFNTINNTIEVTVGYTGMSTVAYGEFYIEMPAGVTAVTANPAATEGFTNGVYSYVWSYGTTPKTVDTADGSGVITTLTLSAENLTSDAAITLLDKSYIGDADFTDYEINKGTASNATATLPHNPNAPETVDTTPAPVATDDPNVTPKPTVAPEVASEKAFVFGTPTANADNTEITVDVNYAGMPTVGYGEFYIQMPSEVTAVVANPAGTEGFTNGRYSYVWSYGTTPVSSTDGTGKITTLTLTLSKPLTEAKQIVIADGSYIGDADFNDFEVGKTDGVLASSVNLPYSSEEPETYDIDFSDAITKTVDDTVGDDGESQYFLIPEVTVNDEPATYGDDYVAVIGDTELTPAQYSNLINGHLDADNVKDIVADNNIKDINDVVKNLKIRAYNEAAKVSAKLVAKDTGVVADSGEATSGDKPAETTKYAASTVKLAKSGTQSIKTNSGKQTNTLTVTTGKDKDGNARDFGTLTFQLDKDSVEALTLAGVVITYTVDADYGVAAAATADTETVTVKVTDDDPVVLGESTDGKYTITFTPGAKGTVKYTATYDGYNKKGEAETQTATVTYKITEPSTGGGSSSSSSSSDKNTSSGGGAIASGLVDSGSSYVPSLGFDDLGDVDWAQTAINTLAARKIVSGVGDNKFDPNAALTRAAYAQMLVNAIGHSTDSADTYFDDVPTDAWFYHNVAVAAQLGIVSGYGDGNFGPYDLITREQMALMTLKAAEVMGVSLVGADAGTFTDDADIADWSRDAVYTLSNAGIINGMGDGTFAPKANATRAQAAVIIYNTFIK